MRPENQRWLDARLRSAKREPKDITRLSRDDLENLNPHQVLMESWRHT